MNPLTTDGSRYDAIPQWLTHQEVMIDRDPLGGAN